MSVLLLIISALFCPRRVLSAYSSVDSGAVEYGSIVTVSCDEGFIFPGKQLEQVIRCVASIGQEAHWDTDGL